MGSIGRNEGGGQSSKYERLDFASSSICVLELAKMRARTGSILPIQALACSNWQNWE